MRKWICIFCLVTIFGALVVGCTENQVSLPIPTSLESCTPSVDPTRVPTISPLPSNSPSPTMSVPVGNPWPYNLPIYSVDRKDHKICLTINCAWGADDIPQILDILDTYNVKTTFFMLGKWAENNPEEARAIYQRGHEIGNHSYNHVLPPTKDDTQKGKTAIENVIGVSPKFYRAPSGEYTKECIDYAYSLGMIPIQWSADTVDWKYTEVESLDRLRKDTASGGIMLFHNDTDTILSLLPKVLDEFQQKGFTFVPLSELLYPEPYTVSTWGVQKKSS